MKKTLARWFEDHWYTEMYISPWFTPLCMIYADAVRLRRFLYRIGVLRRHKLPVPVIIVGNITVGGVGKTPLVIRLSELLTRHGYKPGVISRGYSGKDNGTPQRVNADSDPARVGDEAVVLARACGCPVAIGANRVAASRLLLSEYPCDVIVSDDGLQHYALARDLEIAVIDGERRFGNGYCLPSGPLREPPERIKEVDLVVVNGGGDLQPGEFGMRYVAGDPVNLLNGETRPLAEFRAHPCHALAGVGNPGRFFKQLAAAGLDCEAHAFTDHHAFVPGDIKFKDNKPVMMTEKDAVKCLNFAEAKHWYLPVKAELPEAFTQKFLQLLKEKVHG